MPAGFVFFDLGQTLIDEREFLRYFDGEFLRLLNGFGAKVDERGYMALRDSIIRDRLIAHGSIRELALEVCRLLLPAGYGSIILEKIEPEIVRGRMRLFRVFDDVRPTLERLAGKGLRLGVIANQPREITEIVRKAGIENLFQVLIISTEHGISKPDPRIFQLAIGKVGADSPEQCVMVGDRLDTDIAPANKIGMKTIRVTSSLFSLQTPRDRYETPDYTVGSLAEIPDVVEEILSIGSRKHC